MSDVNPVPLPVPKRTSAPELDEYWERADRGVLALAFCRPCNAAIWYPRNHCPRCGHSPVEWVDSSGRGTIYTYTIVGRGIGDYRDATDYVLAYVELEEGPRMLTNIVDWRPDDLAVGAAVEVVFARGDDGSVLPRFRCVHTDG